MHLQRLKMEKDFFVSLRVSELRNNTFLGQILSTNQSHVHIHRHYDAEGAVYYILAVIFMYGCSILMMIGSFARKSRNDNHVTAYMKDLERVGKLELKQEKFRTKLQMHNKKVHRMLGPDRAEIVDEQTLAAAGVSPSPSPTSICGEVFSWAAAGTDQAEGEEEERRPSSSSINTIIVSAEELDNQLLNQDLLNQESFNQSAMRAEHKQSMMRTEHNHNTQREEHNQQDQNVRVELEDSGVQKGAEEQGVMMGDIPVVRIHMCE